MREKLSEVNQFPNDGRGEGRKRQQKELSSEQTHLLHRRPISIHPPLLSSPNALPISTHRNPPQITAHSTARCPPPQPRQHSLASRLPLRRNRAAARTTETPIIRLRQSVHAGRQRIETAQEPNKTDGFRRGRHEIHARHPPSQHRGER